MQTAKRARNNSVRNYDGKKRRINLIKTIDTNCVSEGSFTHFEDLPNENIYEIFEFLDFFHVYQSFFDLNIRFRKLLTCSNLPIKLNVPLISRSNLQRYYTDIIIPYSHRITSLCITNSFTYNLDNSPHHLLSKFTRLETLILENFESIRLESILKDVTTLSNLSSLVIIPADRALIKDWYAVIFRLPALKYCKMLSRKLYSLNQLLIDTSVHSSIEQLVIKDEIHTDDLVKLLFYVPQLRRLSVAYSNTVNNSVLNRPITLNHLTHLFLKIHSLSFNNFELLMKSLFRTTQVLHISIGNGEEYMDANRWEQLISSFMPFLRVFDIYIDGSNFLSYESRIDAFNSSFWLERQWFFAYQGYSNANRHEIAFYSTTPYRRQEYTFMWKMNQLAPFDYQKNNFTSVRHVRIISENAISNCLYHFPNTTDLTLQSSSFGNLDLFIPTLKQMIPLQNLSKLVITFQLYSFEKLVELLSLTPNIFTLNINRLSMNLNYIDSIETNETFQTVSNMNSIKNLTVTQINQLEEVELLLILCSRLEHLEIKKCQNRTASIVRLLSSKNTDIAKHLNSFYIFIDDQNYLTRITTMYRANKLLNDCIIKVQSNQLYVWR